MFDTLVRELSSQFGLGGKADALVRAVLTYLFQEQPGGLSGFLDRFRRAGLGDLVTSWIGNPAPREITTAQLDKALGADLLNQLAGNVGLTGASVKPALAMLLPKLIGMLTADGRVPTGVPAAVTSWLGGTGARTLGTYQTEPVAVARSISPWLIGLLGLGALALLWFLWPTTPTAPPVATQSAPPAGPATAPVVATAGQWPVKIYFETDSKTLGAEDSARIQRAAEYLKSNPASTVDITGFADQTGSGAANEELAKERAQTVRGALVAAGVPEARTTLAPPSSVTGGANDREARRVEIRLKSS
jgi:uncharacterized protein YidB (DUF937 family)